MRNFNILSHKKLKFHFILLIYICRRLILFLKSKECIFACSKENKKGENIIDYMILSTRKEKW